MKLLRLEMNNLASLEGENVIDFEGDKLRDAQIFSITGVMGSGKSTILDAISLALYGRTPRYTRKKGDRGNKYKIMGESDNEEKNRLATTDPRNILTRGRKSCYSRLTFVGNDGNTYRSQWSTNFKTKNYGDAVMDLVRLDGLNEEPCELSLLDRLIGLDFEQFQRTVLIAQGDFAKFLAADEDDRCRLLEKLVGNGPLYMRIVQHIVAGKDEASQQFEIIKRQCDEHAVNMLQPEEVEQLNQEIATLTEHQAALKERAQAIDDALKWYTADEKQQRDIEQYRQAHDDALEARRAHDTMCQRLMLRDALAPAITIYHDMDGAKRDAEQARKTAADIEGRIEAQTTELKKQRTLQQQKADAVAAAKTTLEEQQPHIATARTLKVELGVASKREREADEFKRQAEKLLQAANTAIEQNTTQIEKAKTALEDAKKKLEQKTGEVNKRRDELGKKAAEAEKLAVAAKGELDRLDLGKLQAAAATAVQVAKHADKALDIQQRLAKNATNLKNCNDEVDRLGKRNTAITAELEKIDVEAAKVAVETIKETKTILSSKDLTKLRPKLRESEPCPLCGATHHPYASHEVFRPAVEAVDVQLREAEERLRHDTERKQALNSEFSSNKGKIDILNGQINSLRAEIDGLKQQWSEIIAMYPTWQASEAWLKEHKVLADKEQEKTEAAMQDYNNKQAALIDAQQKSQDANKALTDYKAQSDKELDDLRDGVNGAERSLAELNSLVPTLNEQQAEKKSAFSDASQAWQNAVDERKGKQEAFNAELQGRDPEEVERQLTKALADASDALEQQKKQVDKVDGNLKTLDGQKQTVKQQHDQCVEKHGEHKQKLEQWLEAYNAAHVPVTVDMVAELFNANDDWESQRATMQRLDTAVTRAKTTLDNAVQAHDDHQASKPEHDKATLAAQQQKLTEDDKEGELIEKRVKKTKHDQALEQLGALSDQLQQAKTNLDDWEAIYHAIGNKEGGNLRKIAQCYTLRFLVEHANAEIRRFNNRYELEQVRNSLGIRVIDHDRFNDRRDTTSLSGGETFIVSLGLALGLSSLSTQNTSFSHLFIDEGFGSLDPSTLSEVINALSMMQMAKGKKVCVISHTDTMVEKITTQIRVVKNGNSGTSHIEI